MPRSSHLGAFLAGAVLATCAFGWAGPTPAEGAGAQKRPAKSEKRFQKLDVFARVLSYVENNYVEPIDERKLIYGAAKGMVHTLDPHSSFLTPEEFAELQADNEGEFGGVGLQIGTRDGQPVIDEVLPGTPAARAGLRAGDVIVAIDGVATRGEDAAGGAMRLRGQPGTKVVIRVHRAGDEATRAAAQTLDVTVTREVIRVQAVESFELPGGLLYIKIKQFQERTDEEVRAALEAHKKAHGGKIAGLVLDLRGNPGGLLDQAVRIVDLFVAEGVIVTTRGRGGKTLDEEVAHEGGTFGGFPIVCLVNGQSASAAEILAGALQDHGRAALLGTRTFGKGSVQSLIPLEDGSGLKLTVARYYTPKGRAIQERGIVPDLEVPQLDPEKLAKAREAEEVEREEDLEGHLKNEAGAGAGRGKGQGARDREKLAAAAGEGPAAGSPEARLASDHQLSVAYQTLVTYTRLKK